MRYFCRQRIGAKMDDDRGMNMGMDADNIEGIFNFCDAWCERCTFTNRCLNYKMRAEFEQEAIRREREKQNKAFWDQVHAAIEDVADLLDEPPITETTDTSFEVGEDMEDDYSDESHRKGEDFKAHFLSTAAEKYRLMTESWFRSVKSWFKMDYDMDGGHIKMIIDGEDDILKLVELGVHVEVIQWYRYQLWVKLQVALKSRDDENYLTEEMGPLSSISDGYAKVCLIGIDNSLLAWNVIRKHIRGEVKAINRIRILLTQLQKAVEREFPNARAFKRPGFDDI